jgi:transcriptional regulator of acetoin/glycerol metabolism
MCQLNLTLDLPIAESVKRLARERNVPIGRAARLLVEQRLKLEAAGWGPNDRELFEILKQVCSLPEKERKRISNFLKKKDLMPKPESGSVEGLVEDSFFESSKFKF